MQQQQTDQIQEGYSILFSIERILQETKKTTNGDWDSSWLQKNWHSEGVSKEVHKLEKKLKRGGEEVKSVIAWQLRGHVSFPGLQVDREVRVLQKEGEMEYVLSRI